MLFKKQQQQTVISPLTLQEKTHQNKTLGKVTCLF